MYIYIHTHIRTYTIKRILFTCWKHGIQIWIFVGGGRHNFVYAPGPSPNYFCQSTFQKPRGLGSRFEIEVGRPVNRNHTI